MNIKYVIDGTPAADSDHPGVSGDNTFPFGIEQRPTGELIAQCFGRGEYTTYRPDGQALRTYTVRLNRKQTLSVDSIKATGLEGLSTLNLERLIKRFEGITKIWPAGVQRQVRQVEHEIQRRKALIDSLAAKMNLAVAS